MGLKKCKRLYGCFLYGFSIAVFWLVLIAVPMRAQAAVSVQNGVMTLKNDGAALNIGTVTGYSSKSSVTKITCESNTVFPENCAQLFKGYDQVTEIDLSGADFSKTTNFDEMFYGDDALNVLKLNGTFKEVTVAMCLPVDFTRYESWGRDSITAEKLDHQGRYAVFENDGTHTYYKRKLLEFEYIKSGYAAYGSSVSVSRKYSNCSYTHLQYVWKRDGIAIQGAEESQYYLVAEDIGKVITCVVSDKTGTYVGEFEISFGTCVKESGPSKPANLSTEKPSKTGASDGKIIGVTTEMEYSTSEEFTDAKPCGDGEVTGLKAGTYYVRYAETETRKPGQAAQVVISEGPGELLFQNGVLTISGIVQADAVKRFEQKQEVTSIVFAPGAVMPYDCSSLFSQYNKCTSIDFTNTSFKNVGNTSRMFSYCYALKSINWGNMQEHDTANVKNMTGMFQSCNSIKNLDLSKFDTSKVTDMSYMFKYCNSIKTIRVDSFDTSNVTNMESMFVSCESLQSIDISSWNTAKVTTMKEMFEHCKSLTLVKLGNIDTGNVTDMSYMFRDCQILTSLDLDNLKTGKVTKMEDMFSECSSLKSIKLSGFDVSNVESMAYMFHGCSSLQSVDLSTFTPSKVTSTRNMFSNCADLKSVNLGNFDTSHVTTMYQMFLGCQSLQSLDMSKQSTENVTVMTEMFRKCDALQSLTLGNKDMSKVLIMQSMFNSCSALQSLDLSGVRTSSVNNMENMFLGCASLKTIDLSKLTTNNVTTMKQMFTGCKSLENVTFGSMNLGKVQNMYGLFRGCESLQSIDISGVTLGSVTDMSDMFRACKSLQNVKFGDADTSTVTNMEYMFSQCESLTTFDVGQLKTGSVTEMRYMFSECKKLKAINISGWDTGNVTSMTGMFSNCESLVSADLHLLDVTKVTSFQSLFNGCRSLTNVNCAGLDTQNCTSFYAMFEGCSSLQSLDLSSFTISADAYHNRMFYNAGLMHLTLGDGITGIDSKYDLANKSSGWCRGDDEANRISGSETYAVFTNSGVNTYHKRTYLTGALDTEGSAVYGETLTVSARIYEGPPVAQLAYQWKRDGVDIPGATGTSYTLGLEDIRKNITCVATDPSGLYKGTLERTFYSVRKIEGPEAPVGLQGFSPSTESGSDGRITGVTDAMEYTEVEYTRWKKCQGDTITGLPVGSYYVRYAETDTQYAGKNAKVTIAATDADSTRPVTERFTDVKAGAWYVKAVQYVYERKIMTGKGEKFDPNSSITRAEFAQTLYSHMGKPEIDITNAKSLFPDLVEGQWYIAAVLWAKENGIVSGYGNGNFGPNDPITREQLALMLYKYMKLRHYGCSYIINASDGFMDSDKISSWAKEAMDWAVADEIMAGKGTSGSPISERMLDPKGQATRAECAAMIKKLLEKRSGE